MNFIETTCDKDSHWTTQTSQCRQTHEVVVLEKFTKWWNDRGFPAIDKLNTTKGDVDLSPELIERIEEHYKKDVRLYREAL